MGSVSVTDPAAAAAQAHVLVFPFPAQGHVTSMLNLAELLSLSGGLRVTFLNSDHNHRRMRSFSASFSRLSRHPSFRFLSIPDGLPDGHPRSASHLMDLEESLRTRSILHFRRLLTAAQPPVTCVVADAIMKSAVDAAEDLGIPSFAFRTSSASSFCIDLRIPDLFRSDEIPFASGADLDELVGGIPGVQEGFLRRRDLGSFWRAPPPAADGAVVERLVEFVSTINACARRARGVIFNTAEFLEAPALAHVRSHCADVYAVGPLLKRGGGSASLLEEDRECISWLDSQPRRSVVYVSFGSFTVMSPEELTEFWHGLVGSGYRFLWVVRPGLGKEGTEEVAAPPAGLEAAVAERGRLVRWVPQVEVLGHPAVGCFLTHGGWNSVLESVAAGVPMVCWPFFADQQVNSRFVEAVWGVGRDMKDRCGRETVEEMVRAAMEGDAAAEMRRAAAEAAAAVGRSVEVGGDSHDEVERLVSGITSLSAQVVQTRANV